MIFLISCRRTRLRSSMCSCTGKEQHSNSGEISVWRLRFRWLACESESLSATGSRRCAVKVEQRIHAIREPGNLRNNMRARLFSHLSTAALLLILLLPQAASAHVNSPDVYYDGNAGPYHLLVTIRPPAVVPGIAQIQIRVAEGDVDAISIRPMRLTGPGAKLAPTSDGAQRSPGDPHLYTGQLWIMSRGSW